MSLILVQHLASGTESSAQLQVDLSFSCFPADILRLFCANFDWRQLFRYHVFRGRSFSADCVCVVFFSCPPRSCRVFLCCKGIQPILSGVPLELKSASWLPKGSSPPVGAVLRNFYNITHIFADERVLPAFPLSPGSSRALASSLRSLALTVGVGLATIATGLPILRSLRIFHVRTVAPALVDGLLSRTPELRELAISLAPFAAESGAVVASRCPKLERLTLGTRQSFPDGSIISQSQSPTTAAYYVFLLPHRFSDSSSAATAGVSPAHTLATAPEDCRIRR